MDTMEARQRAPIFFSLIDAVSHIQTALERSGQESGLFVAVSEKAFLKIVDEMASIDATIWRTYTPGVSNKADGTVKEMIILGNVRVYCKTRKETYEYDFRKNMTRSGG